MFKLFRVYMRNSFCFGVGEEGWVTRIIDGFKFPAGS